MGLNFLFSFFILITGIGLLAAGIVTFFRQRQLLARSQIAQGTVVELLTTRRSGEYRVKRTSTGFTLEPKRLFRPVVRFTAPNGRDYEIRAPVASSPARLQIGDPVPIRYDPADPSTARIDSPLYLWFGAGMLVFFGFFAIGMGLLGIVLESVF